MSDNIHRKIFVSDNRFLIFDYFIINYIAYVTVQYYHGKQPGGHDNKCSVSEKIWMI